jgi:hypothetical protein
MDQTVVRTLSYYPKGRDFLAGEYPLNGVDVGDLRTLFGIDSGNPMFDVYPVGPEQVTFLQKVLHRELDLETFDYFVECHSSAGG